MFQYHRHRDVSKASNHPRHLLEEGGEGAVEARAPFEFVDSESTGVGTTLGSHAYRTLFLDNNEGEGSKIKARSILRTRVEKQRSLRAKSGSNPNSNGTRLLING